MEYIVATAVLGIIIGLFVFIDIKRRKRMSDTTVCTDKYCVRCTKYAEIRKRSLRLFKENMHGLTNSDSEKLYRIKSSLDKCDYPPDGRQRPNVFYLQGLIAMPWPVELSQSLKNDVAAIEQNFEMITNEFDNIIETQPEHWTVNNTPNGYWEVFHLINQGKAVDKNVKLVPKTFKLVTELSSVMTNTVFGNVSFSIVYPGTTISDHYGPTNIRLRCHLGLETSPNCTITVDGIRKTWLKGKTILFDDSFLHGVNYPYNDKDMFRAVLILDMWHPGISSEERKALTYMFSPD